MKVWVLLTANTLRNTYLRRIKQEKPEEASGQESLFPRGIGGRGKGWSKSRRQSPVAKFARRVKPAEIPALASPTTAQNQKDVLVIVRALFVFSLDTLSLLLPVDCQILHCLSKP